MLGRGGYGDSRRSRLLAMAIPRPVLVETPIPGRKCKRALCAEVRVAAAAKSAPHAAKRHRKLAHYAGTAGAPGRLFNFQMGHKSRHSLILLQFAPCDLFFQALRPRAFQTFLARVFPFQRDRFDGISRCPGDLHNSDLASPLPMREPAVSEADLVCEWRTLLPFNAGLPFNARLPIFGCGNTLRFEPHDESPETCF
jgi:hypothetical protein